jgi:microcompartment protein CcmL/EutN
MTVPEHDAIAMGAHPHTPGPALAMLEISDLPAGFAALDALAKEAPVVVIAAGTIQQGHYLVAFAGDVEPVELSFARAVGRAAGALVDAVLLPYAERRILPALRDGTVLYVGGVGGIEAPPGDALGVLQTATSPTLLRALDAALKGAEVELVELRIAEGLGGRALATLWGKQHDVEAAVELATEAFARGHREGCSTAVIANADREVGRSLRHGTRFFKELRG